MTGMLLAGCQTQGPGVTKELKFVVVSPPSSFYKCPAVKVPNPNGLKNRDVNRYIAGAYEANKTCRINMNNIKKYVEKAKTNAR